MWSWTGSYPINDTPVPDSPDIPRKRFSQNNSSAKISPYNDDEDMGKCCYWNVVSKGIVATKISTTGKEMKRRVRFEEGNLHIASWIKEKKISLDSILCCNYVGDLITVHMKNGGCIVLVVEYESTARSMADAIGKYEIH